MQEFVSLRPQPHLTDNYFPSVDYLPDTYSYTVNQDLGIKGKDYNAGNDGFAGFISMAEVALIASLAFSADPRKRERIRRQLARRARRTLGTAARFI